ncbi:MAG TPA: TetR/AcrR family transcriptional regulator [Clostridia bacterium]|nr:TetR/AcrR family transcriptional regulator [Clostridia bacterium]
MGEKSTQDRILAIAEGRFIADGIEKTQMTDIAKDCGINRRTLYRYFPTKDLLAFEVEMIVMDRIQRYLGALVAADEPGTGADHIRAYFSRVDLLKIQDWIRFTAEFDRYFQNDYPDGELTREFIERIRPDNDPLYRYIEEGIADGSIQTTESASNLYHFIAQSFFALFQRLILRRNHLKYEHCADVDFEGMFRKLMLRAIGA